MALQQQLQRFANAAALAEAVAAEIARLITEKEGAFHLALSGGQTPRPLYQHLADRYDQAIDWSKVHLYWGDERYVANDDPASSYGMAKRLLIDRVTIPPEQIYPMPTEFREPKQAARAYEITLQQQLPAGSFDLILLGIGTDGHTASLFPGSPALQERDAWVVATEAADGPRLTLTYPLINRAQRVYFLASGPEKRPLVEAVVAGAAAHYPVAQVRAQEVRWYLAD